MELMQRYQKLKDKVILSAYGGGSTSYCIS